MAFAGAAAAEVKVSGDARMGVTYLENAANEFQANHRVRIKFTASGTTDGGLDWEAAARIRAGHEVNAAGAGTDTNAVNQVGVTISGAFGSLTFGSESTAAEYAVGDLAGVNYGPGPVNNETKFHGTAAALYSYTTGGLSFYLSSGQIGSDDVAVGAKYAADALTVGIGYEDDGASTQITASGSYKIADTTLKAVYGTNEDTDFDQYGVSVSHKMGATTLKAFYRQTETAGVDADFYGIGADYALGGGATLAGGVSSNDGTTAANLGLKFSF